ncbi:MAG TPA: hypothetical protein VFK69_12590 [Candidatus Eisenbacteria bacterium]|nr:hypothetical protein [Candidatus Eisenbacteria bacterium]
MIALVFYRFADLIVRWLPPRLADGLSVAVARAAFVLRLPPRQCLERNLERLMQAPGEGAVRDRAREAYDNFALTFTDFLRLGHAGGERLAGAVEVHGGEHLEAARASGRGVILLSAHLGNWELGAAWLASRGTPVNVVARPHSSRVERFFAARRRRLGVRMLPGRPLWRAAAAALRRHEWVAVMADREATAHLDGDVASPRHSACAWASALSRRTGALVLPGVIVRLPDRRYAAYFDKPMEPEALRDDTHVEALRRWVRRFPGQWFAFEPLPRGLA